MAVVIRQALFRGRGINMSELEEHSRDNREALMRQESISRMREENADDDYYELSPRNEAEIKRKEHAKLVAKQLMQKKLKKIAYFKKRLKVYDTIAAILSIGGVFLAFIDVENNYNGEDKKRNQSSTYGSLLRSTITISTLILVFLTFKHHSILYQITRERQTTSEGVGSNFLGSNQFKWM